ncbi:MAG: SUMF1/EgtB/PvdO family nonheme iron enzyme, partial [Bacteroidota bacterium]
PYLASYGLASEPDSLALLNAKGVAAFQSGQFDSAFIFYEAVLGQEPQESHVLHNLELMHYNEGRILHGQGNFPLALSSYLSLSTPTIQESDESRYARSLAWAYLDSTHQARALSDSLSSQTDSPWISRRNTLNSLLTPTLVQVPKEPSDGQILRQTQLSDSSQLSILPFLNSPYPEIRSAALALLGSQARWDRLIAERIPPLLADPAPALRLQAAIALLAHPPLADSLLAQIQPVFQAAEEPKQSLLAYSSQLLQSPPIANPPTPFRLNVFNNVDQDTSREDDFLDTLPDTLPVFTPDSASQSTDSLLVSELPVQPTMIFIQGGSFQMGSEEGDDDERPVHEVTVSDFYLAETEVTNAQYLAFANATNSHFPEWMEEGSRYNLQTGSNRSVYKGFTDPDQPVVGVSWLDAVAYCEWLSQQTGNTYRLPTEAEWEFAARGGKVENAQNFTYSGSNTVEEVGWYTQNSESRTHPVRQKLPNGLGLYDMSGNVWEWCQDWYGAYPPTPQTNPQGPEGGSYRVLRGGSWSDDATYLRVSRRNLNVPSGRNVSNGFRPARNP